MMMGRSHSLTGQERREVEGDDQSRAVRRSGEGQGPPLRLTVLERGEERQRRGRPASDACAVEEGEEERKSICTRRN